MKITISDANKILQFSTILGNLKQFLENTTCQIKEDGMYFQGLDQTHSCMIECRLKKEWFDLYENDENLVISFNTTMIQKVLNARHESQEIEIEYEKDDDVLMIGFTKGNNFNKTFEISLLHVENNNFEIQDTETDVDLTIDTKKMHDLIANLANFNDELNMNFTEDKIIFAAKGLEGTMNVEIDFNDVTEYAVGENTELTQSFNLKILNQMCNYCKLTNEMNIGFTNGRPMNLKYLVGDNSYVQFYLAPKVDD